MGRAESGHRSSPDPRWRAAYADATQCNTIGRASEVADEMEEDGLSAVNCRDGKRERWQLE
jgi:hypothetical protein